MTGAFHFLPALTAENRSFWAGGAEGELRIMRCTQCDLAIHPPELICPRCLSQDVRPKTVPGTGSIYSFTINHQPWLPGLAVPYAIAAVDVDGPSGVRITARVIGPDAEEVSIGDRVSIEFEQASDEVWIPCVRRVI